MESVINTRQASGSSHHFSSNYEAAFEPQNQELIHTISSRVSCNPACGQKSQVGCVPTLKIWTELNFSRKKKNQLESAKLLHTPLKGGTPQLHAVSQQWLTHSVNLMRKKNHRCLLQGKLHRLYQFINQKVCSTKSKYCRLSSVGEPHGRQFPSSKEQPSRAVQLCSFLSILQAAFPAGEQSRYGTAARTWLWCCPHQNALCSARTAGSGSTTERGATGKAHGDTFIIPTLTTVSGTETIVTHPAHTATTKQR